MQLERELENEEFEVMEKLLADEETKRQHLLNQIADPFVSSLQGK